MIKEAIISILNKMEVRYSIVGYDSNNIVVSINPSSNRLVIGAHYDAYYFGANDNAAACVILLNLINSLKDSDKSIDFVFFDREEQGGIGSKDYIRCVGSNNIKAMINLDMCGMGSNILLCYDQLNTNTLNEKPFKDIIANCNNVVSNLPFGDYHSFILNKIPAIFIVNSTTNDLKWFNDYSKYYMVGKKAEFLATMHQMTDKPDTFTAYGMNMIYDYLIDKLK